MIVIKDRNYTQPATLSKVNYAKSLESTKKALSLLGIPDIDINKLIGV